MAINAGKAEVTVVGKFKDEITSKSKKAFDKLKSGAKAAFKAATVAVTAFSAGMAVAIAKANEQELAIAKLEGALRSTGKFTKELSLEMQAMASSFQRASTTGDEEILSLQSLLFAMGATTENIKQVTQATLDLSAGMGVQAKGAALLFGKALSGDFGTLSRYGILVSDVEGNANKMASALQQVQDKFGGQAQAQADTFGGKMKQVANAFGDVLEEIGFVITKDQRLVDVLKKMVTWFEKVGTQIRDNRRFLRALGTEIFNDVKAIWKPFGIALGFIFNGFRAIAGIALNIRGQFNKLTGDVAKANEMFRLSNKLFADIADSIKAPAEGFMALKRGAKAVVPPLDELNETLTTTKGLFEGPFESQSFKDALEDKIFASMEEAIKLEADATASKQEFFKALDIETQFLELKSKGLEKQIPLLKAHEALRKATGQDLTVSDFRAIRERIDLQQKFNEKIEDQARLTATAERVFDNFGDGMVRALQDGRDAFESFKDAALAALFDIQREMIKTAIFDPIKKAAGSFLSNAGGSILTSLFSGFAHGGAVQGNQPIVVGERGPELFTPSGGGRITPNNEMGGGGVTINQKIEVGTAQTVRVEMMNLMPMFIEQAKRAIADERQRSVAFSSQMGI
jgi:hypothetical protein